MDNCRVYGRRPYSIAVVHGGPGAPGSVAAIARELSGDYGVLEPIQTETSLEGQIQELYKTLCEYGDTPVILIGHSWGAWLSFIMTARYPAIVRKLILVGSGPFRAEYVKALEESRFSRMSSEERTEAYAIIEALDMENTVNKDEKLARLGELVEKADNYDIEQIETEKADKIPVEGNTFRQVWSEASELRRNGRLLEYGRQIKCPVIAIHGDYDPHPAEGVKKPLSGIVGNFQFHLLEKCGHSPWKEKYARGEFYRIIREELK